MVDVLSAFGKIEHSSVQHTYNGLGYRTGWHYDHCNTGCTAGPDGSVTADDPWIYFQGS